MILTWELFIEHLHDNPIADIDIYNSRMNGSILDKLYFLDKIDFDIIVDFGCADGVLLEEISKFNKNIKLIGYEIDPQELKISREKVGRKAFITDEWVEIEEKLEKFEDTALCLSSVIHEVYSYTDDQSNIDRFWNERVFGGQFKYIIIRDMIPSSSIDSITNFNDNVKIVKEKIDKKYINSFEKIWGKMEDSYLQFTHFLLKYKYTNNWNREVQENYFPIKLNELKAKIPANYKIVLEDNFILQYINDQVKNDFGFELRMPTHTKMILKRND